MFPPSGSTGGGGGVYVRGLRRERTSELPEGRSSVGLSLVMVVTRGVHGTPPSPQLSRRRDNMISTMKALDAARVYAADKAITDYERKARRMKRLQTKKLEDQYEDKQQYEAGMF
ncbi:hypothetical protein J6590_097586 [Homalodisca vitripennis]|nr:hypothetical protein J6590_097586 [Homalodisca vitripennis]